MRSSNTDHAHGTIGNPQTTIEQLEYAFEEAANEAALKDFADNLPLIDESLITEMESAGVKFNKADVILTTRDATGQPIWLEKGNPLAGYEHIEKRGHIEQLAKHLGIEESEVLRALRNSIRDGRIISDKTEMRNGRLTRERIYEYDGRHLLVALGTNGFIVSAYPEHK